MESQDSDLGLSNQKPIEVVQKKKTVLIDADTAIETVLQKYKPDAVSIDETDGVSLAFDNWRFNLRKSNNEPLVRLNIEARGNIVDINQKLEDIKSLIT